MKKAFKNIDKEYRVFQKEFKKKLKNKKTKG